MYARILFGHDGSSASDAIVPDVASLAHANAAHVIVLHTLELPGPLSERNRTADADGTSVPHAIHADARERANVLERLVWVRRWLLELGAPRVTVLVTEAPTDREAIEQVTLRERCDLVVLPFVADGSATTEIDRLLETAGVPALMLRPHGSREPAPSARPSEEH